MRDLSSADKLLIEASDNKWTRGATDSFVWHITDEATMLQLTGGPAQGQEIHSNVFRLLQHEWYISISRLTITQRSAGGPECTQAHMWIGLNCIMNEEAIDCMQTLSLLQTGQSAHFYEHFASSRDRGVLRSKPRRTTIDVEAPETVLALNDVRVRRLKLKAMSIKVSLEIFSPVPRLARDMADEKDGHCDNEVAAWLRDVVRLPQYQAVFASKGFDTLDIVKLINENDLGEFNIPKLGHFLKLWSEVMKLRMQDRQ